MKKTSEINIPEYSTFEFHYKNSDSEKINTSLEKIFELVEKNKNIPAILLKEIINNLYDPFSVLHDFESYKTKAEEVVEKFKERFKGDTERYLFEFENTNKQDYIQHHVDKPLFETKIAKTKYSWKDLIEKAVISYLKKTAQDEWDKENKILQSKNDLGIAQFDEKKNKFIFKEISFSKKVRLSESEKIRILRIEKKKKQKCCILFFVDFIESYCKTCTKKQEDIFTPYKKRVFAGLLVQWTATGLELFSNDGQKDTYYFKKVNNQIVQRDKTKSTSNKLSFWFYTPMLELIKNRASSLD